MLTALMALIVAGQAVAAPPAATASARIVSPAGRWAGLGQSDALRDDDESLYVISGEIENTGAVPIAHVKLAFELLADRPDGEQVVASEYGYNRRAEGLRDPEVESGRLRPESLAIAPLAPGERDLFRMVFFLADVPRFDRFRVRILAVEAAHIDGRLTPPPTPHAAARRWPTPRSAATRLAGSPSTEERRAPCCCI